MSNFNDLIKASEIAKENVSQLSTDLAKAESLLSDSIKEAYKAFPYSELAKLKSEEDTHERAQVKLLEAEAEKLILEHFNTDAFKSNIIAIRSFLAAKHHTEVNQLFISESQGGLGAINGLAFFHFVATVEEKKKVNQGLQMVGRSKTKDYQRLGLTVKAFSATKSARIEYLESFLDSSMVAPLRQAEEELKAAEELKQLNARNSSLIAKCTLKDKPSWSEVDEVIILNNSKNEAYFYGFDVPANGQKKVKPLIYQNQTGSESMFNPRQENKFKDLFRNGVYVVYRTDRGEYYKAKTITDSFKRGVYEW